MSPSELKLQNLISHLLPDKVIFDVMGRNALAKTVDGLNTHFVDSLMPTLNARVPPVRQSSNTCTQ